MPFSGVPEFQEREFSTTHAKLGQVKVVVRVAGARDAPTWERDWKPRLTGLREHDFPWHGDLLPQVFPTLVGLSADAALSLGGVEVVTDEGHKVLTWPTAHRAGVGYCLNCHRHNTLQEPPTSAPANFRCSACGHEQENDGLWVETLTS